jgi:membrane protease YdiL (CAAX protease family)
MRIPPSYISKTKGIQLLYPEKISDEEILDLKNRRLWSSTSSLSLTFAAFIFMNFIAFLIIFIFIIFNIGTGNIVDLVTNPYIVILSSLTELIFIVLPVLYVGKYLKNPSINNRFAILGFTRRGYSTVGILKEILIGLSFALLGLFLVAFTSVFMEILLEFIYGIDIVYEFGTSSGEIDALIYNADALSLTLLIIIMILVIGTSEELIFRGFMQKGLVRSIGTKWGILTTALIFSLIHLIGIFIVYFSAPELLMIYFILSFIPYFAISLLLGLLFYWRNENLIAVMITHGVYDAITILLAFMVYNVF